MTKIFTAILVVILFSAVAIASFFLDDNPSPSTPVNNSYAKAHSSILERLDALEKGLSKEAELRQKVETQLEHERNLRMALADRISELNSLDSALAGALENRSNSDRSRQFDPEIIEPDQQVSLLIEAGFNSYEAERVVEVELEMQQALIDARFSNGQGNVRELILEG